jgi:alpha-1,3-rhamnosyl/mannosyltransferase
VTATIGVNLLWLVPGVVGGSEEYTLRLLRSLDTVDADDLWLRIYGRRELFDTHPDLARRFECEVAPARGGKPARVAAENTWLARATRHDDVVHHAGGVVPLVRSRPAVLTIHDLQPLEMPQNFSMVKRRWLRAVIPRSAHAARLVVCPSRFTADRIHDLLGVPETRTRVVPQGHDDDPVDEGISGAGEGTAAELHRRYGRYLLYPSISYAHKRHIDLVAALDHLRNRFADLSVVFTGRPGPEDGNLRAQAAERCLSERIHLLGRVPVDELDALYRSAEAVVIPSEYEGFGNPVLEAMARGRPVIVADAGALPEVCGDAGLVVAVRHPVALAAAVARVLDEPGLAERLSVSGLERSRDFSWSEAGRRLAGVYRSALQPVC